MSDGYLWDGSGEPDPDVARLEAALRPLRHRPGRVPRVVTRPPSRTALPRAAAALACLLGAVALLTSRRGAGWEVSTLAGTPLVSGRPVPDGAWLREGQWIETDATSRASLRVASFGEVEISPGSRLRVARSSGDEQRLALQRGRIDALILAKPGSFFVQTPSALAADLGCAYSLEVDELGAGKLHVMLGWVSFAREGRESFVPAGAECLTRPMVGPGTPYFDDAAPTFVAALERLDFSGGGAVELEVLLTEARPEDALTLWHLLSRLPAGPRGSVHDRLQELVPAPAGVTRAGIVAGDRRMRDRWWEALGHGSAGFWRSWRIPAP